jgi:AAA+ ATPase superfamily predicted ATPase
VARFIDREKEVRALRERLARPSSLALVYGARRTGKTWLLQHVLRGRPGVVYFLADQTTSVSMLRRFQADVAAGVRGGPAWEDSLPADWGTALSLLFQAASFEAAPLVLAIDECQYLLEAEPAFPSVLQRLWDAFRERLPLHVLLCGSALGTLSRLGDAGQPLHGRFDLRLRLQPFGFREAALFVPSWEPAERMRLYGVFGGLARHLAEVDPGETLRDNAVRAILDPLAPLHEAALDMLRSEHLSSRADADAALAAIAAGECGFNAVAARTGLTLSRLDYVVRELLALELVRRQARSGDRPGGRYTRWRLADPFVRFWFRLVRPNRGALVGTSAARVWNDRIGPRLDDHMGPVFEDIVRQAVLGGALEGEVGPVDEAEAWWSRDGRTEVDLVARAGGRKVFIECKWRAGASVDIDALLQLRDHLARYPRRGEVASALLCVASAGGFSPRLRCRARDEGVLLLGPDRLLSG